MSVFIFGVDYTYAGSIIMIFLIGPKPYITYWPPASQQELLLWEISRIRLSDCQLELGYDSRSAGTSNERWAKR